MTTTSSPVRRELSADERQQIGDQLRWRRRNLPPPRRPRPRRRTLDRPHRGRLGRHRPVRALRLEPAVTGRDFS